VLSGAALAIAVAIALPLGVWLGHLHRGSFLAVNVRTSAARCRASP
jgi:osmoprotectant transport system permease protein